MWLCDIDINEIIRYGGSVIKIYSALVWTASVPNPFADIIKERYSRWLKYIEKGEDISATLEKQNMCSVYGKTVCKDINDKFRFLTKKQASLGVDMTRIIDWEEFDD